MKILTSPSFSPALVLYFEGFYQCRLATDPDPTREKRGVSGYTYALAREDNLDQQINLQESQIAPNNYRDGVPLFPGPRSNFGVSVQRVSYHNPGSPGITPPAGEYLLGAEVFLLNKPIYEMRNQIVSDGVQRIAPVINPFCIRVQQNQHDILLERSDPLADDGSDTPSWELDFKDYQNRVPIYNRPSDEVLIDVFNKVDEYNPGFLASLPPGTQQDSYAVWYYKKRMAWLTRRIDTELKLPKPDQVKISNWKTRKETIEFYTGAADSPGRDFIQGRMGLQTIWQHSIRGVNPVMKGAAHLDGSILNGDWETRFWHGGWDGDLMRGFMKGWLAIPFQANCGPASD